MVHFETFLEKYINLRNTDIFENDYELEEHLMTYKQNEVSTYFYRQVHASLDRYFRGWLVIFRLELKFKCKNTDLNKQINFRVLMPFTLILNPNKLEESEISTNQEKAPP